MQGNAYLIEAYAFGGRPLGKSFGGIEIIGHVNLLQLLLRSLGAKFAPARPARRRLYSGANFFVFDRLGTFECRHEDCQAFRSGYFDRSWRAARSQCCLGRWRANARPPAQPEGPATKTKEIQEPKYKFEVGAFHHIPDQTSTPTRKPTIPNTIGSAARSG